MKATDEGQVRVETDGRVAVIVLDNPPVNAGSVAIRRGLLAAIQEVQARDDIDASVIIGEGRTFVSGSDLREFEGPIAEPQMPAVIAAIEKCSKPVVAAISGNALGGGYEIALVCDARIATRDAYVGLPEVNLGIIPGAGGTQRLPRLTGKAKAIEVITGARRVPASEARALGMIDKIGDDDLRAAAVLFARETKAKRRLSEADVPPDDADALAAAISAARNKGRKNAAILEAIAAIEMAGTMPFEEAIARERATFQRLRQSEESAALRHLFFAERRLMRGAKSAAADFRSIGVVGLGLMGSGIAACLAFAGMTVVVTDRDEAAIRAGEIRISEAINLLAKRSRAGTEAIAAAEARVRSAPNLTGLKDVDLAIEVVFEDLAVKQAVFRELDAILPIDALLVSNTSYLDIDALAGSTRRADRVAGLHFFSPAPLMRPVEVVRGASTAPDVLAALRNLVARIGKLPIVCKNAEGFIGNRILSAYRAQCEFLLEEGALPQDVDRALAAFGMAMGPFAVSDLAGLDIAWSMRKRKAATRSSTARYSPIADRLCEAGRFGRKTNAGWYRYESGSARGEPDSFVSDVIETVSREKNIERRAITNQEICDRVVAAIVNEAAKTLEHRVAEEAGDVDLLMVNGYGFPASKGGPLFWASRQPKAGFLSTVDRMVALSPGTSRAGNLEAVLYAPKTP
jgi:3-hydroxyacyl-CoA dehydrogenase